jgi:hypothetical protein
MDLNYLFHRQQVERFRSESTTCDQARNAHARLAALYEDSIERLTQGRVRFGVARKEGALAVAA